MAPKVTQLVSYNPSTREPVISTSSSFSSEMAPNIFITGTSGYVGGSILSAIATKYPSYEITVLLRTVPAGFTEQYPHAKILLGDYNSTDIIHAAASAADIVIHCNSDHIPAITAILSGLSSRPPTSPSYLLHLSGTGIINDVQMPSPDTPPGSLNPKVWSDTTDIAALTSLPPYYLHRTVDALVQAAPAHVRTAIMCPPDIYGRGTGPGKKQSLLFPWTFDEFIKLKRPFYVGKGENVRSLIHIDDVVRLAVILLEEAVAGGGRVNWGPEAYFFAETQEVAWRDVAEAVGKLLYAHGLVEDAEPVEVSVEQVKGMLLGALGGMVPLLLFGCNVRSRADRARETLGWKAEAPAVWECLEADLAAHQSGEEPNKLEAMIKEFDNLT